MDFKKLLVLAPTQQVFETALLNESISLSVIGFIEEPRLIWALGVYYPCPYSKGELDLIVQDLQTQGENVLETIKGAVTNDYDSLEKIEKIIKANKKASDDANTTLTNNLNTEILDRKDAVLDIQNKLDNTTIVKVVASDNNTIASYELHDSNGNKKGVTIDIPKDQSIKDIKMSTLDATLDSNGMIVDGTSSTALCISYILADGSYKIAHLDYLKFLEETEFSDGTEIVNHKVKVKIDPNSDTEFFTVSTSGVKLAGVRTAIDTEKTRAESLEDKIEASVGLNTDGSHKTTTGNYTKTATTIAGEIAALDTLVKKNSDAITLLNDSDSGFIAHSILAAINALDVSDMAVPGLYVSEVEETDGKIAVTRASVSKATLNEYTKGTDSSAVKATDTINTAISKLENQVDAAIESLDKADTAVSNQFVTSVSETNGVITVNRARPSAGNVSNSAIPASSTLVAINGTDLQTSISNIATAIKTEETRAKNAEQTLTNSLSAETTNRNTAISNAINALDSEKSGSGSHVTVKVVEENGKLTLVAVTENDIASAATLSSHTGNKSNPHAVTKALVGLGNVTNESKTTMFTNPKFTGTPTAPTAASGTNNTQIATTAFVHDAISSVVANAPEDFDTLKEMSDWIATHDNSAATMNSQIQTNKDNISSIQNKLNSIASGAEVNVQSDWNVTNTSSDAFIKNKPGNASTTANGFMTASDKAKLDSIAEGAQANANNFSVIDVGSKTDPFRDKIEPTNPTDTIRLAEGNNITIERHDTYGLDPDHIEIFGTKPTLVVSANIPDATTSKSGLMTASDKTKLNSLSTDVATTSTNGLMSASDKTRLNDLVNNAVTISSAGVSEVGKYIDFHDGDSNSNEDHTVRLYGGDVPNVHIQFPTTSGKLALDNVATTTTNGLMSKEDKTKIDTLNSRYAQGSLKSYRVAASHTGWLRIINCVSWDSSAIVTVHNDWIYTHNSGVQFTFNIYGRSLENSTITQIGGINKNFTKARIVRDNEGTNFWIEVYFNKTNHSGEDMINILLSNQKSCSLLNTFTPGSIPEGGSAKEFEFTDGMMANNFKGHLIGEADNVVDKAITPAKLADNAKLTDVSLVGNLNNQLSITSAGVTKTIDLEPNSQFGTRAINVYNVDFPGKPVLYLIAQLPTNYETTTEAFCGRGFAGTIYSTRDNGFADMFVTSIICYNAYKNDAGSRYLYTSNTQCIPKIVKYNNLYYLGILVKGNNRKITLKGHFVNVLQDFVALYGKDVSNPPTIDGVTYLYENESKPYFPYRAEFAQSATLWNGEQFSDFTMRKKYRLDLSSLSTSNFYPVLFDINRLELNCEIYSQTSTENFPYNNNYIHFLLTTKGWADIVPSFVVLDNQNYDNKEITIGSIGHGIEKGERCVWLRGGLTYEVISNFQPYLKTSDYSIGNEKYTIGTNITGGTNSNVRIVWKNDDTRKNSTVIKSNDTINADTLDGKHASDFTLKTDLHTKDYLITFKSTFEDTFLGGAEFDLKNIPNLMINGVSAAINSAKFNSLYQELYTMLNSGSSETLRANVTIKTYEDDLYTDCRVFRLQEKNTRYWYFSDSGFNNTNNLAAPVLQLAVLNNKLFLAYYEVEPQNTLEQHIITADINNLTKEFGFAYDLSSYSIQIDGISNNSDRTKFLELYTNLRTIFQKSNVDIINNYDISIILTNGINDANIYKMSKLLKVSGSDDKNIIFRNTDNDSLNDYYLYVKTSSSNITFQFMEPQINIVDGLMSASDKAKLDFITSADYEDMLTYGVKWSTSSADPHLTRIGNLNLHKSLPILNGMKGCIAQGGVVKYWLDPDDWRFKEEKRVISSLDWTITKESDDVVCFSIENPTYLTILSIGLYVLAGRTAGKIFQIDGGSSTKFKARFTDTTIDPEAISSWILGSNLTGVDGTVRVYVPEFYIKSVDGDSYKEVRISQINLGSDWTHLPAVLVDAYRSSLLRTVSDSMGYISGKANGLFSVVNNDTLFRGGTNNSSYDTSTDSFKNLLGKPVTNISRATARSRAALADSHLLSYDEYKNIFYWLYVIEYANFNCQETYNSALDSNGCKQGGLGPGITQVSYDYWNYYNGRNPLIPCGYTNSLGNSTGIVPASITMPTSSNGSTTLTYNMEVPRWHGFENPFGDIWTNLDGVIINADAGHHLGNMNYVYTCQDPTKFSDSITEDYSKVGEQIHTDGFIKEFDLGEAAHIIPKSIGGDVTKYKCDYNWVGASDTALRTLIVGGHAHDGTHAGLGGFNSINAVSPSWANVGFRSVSRFLSFSLE